MIRQSLLYFLSRAGNGILALATMALFTRILSPQEYGVYALAMAIPAMVCAVLFQWINIAIARFYHQHEATPEILIFSVARGFWIAVAIAALLFIVALPFHQVFGVKPELFGILFLITVMLGRHSLALQIANSQRAPIRFGLLSWTRSGFALLIGFVLIQYGQGALGGLIGFLAGLMISVVIFNPKPKFSLKFKIGAIPKSLGLFSYGVPMSINFFAIVIVDMSDRFMIGGLLGADQVAPYVVAYELVQQSIGPIMNVLFLAAFPSIVQALEQDGDDSARIRLCTLGCGLITIGLPAVIGLGILSEDISEIILGNKFRHDAAKIMPWVAAAIFLGCLKNYFFDISFQLRNVSKYQVYIALLMAAVNVILNYFLLPLYGVIAAAWSTFASFAIGLLVSWYIGKALFPLPSIRKNFLGVATACVPMAAFLYVLPPVHEFLWIIAKITVGIILYLMMAYMLNLAQCRHHFYRLLLRQPYFEKK